MAKLHLKINSWGLFPNFTFGFSENDCFLVSISADMCHEPITYETSFRAYLAHLAVTFEPGEPGEFEYFLGGVRNLHRKCQYQLFLDDHSEMKEFKGKETTFFLYIRMAFTARTSKATCTPF